MKVHDFMITSVQYLTHQGKVHSLSSWLIYMFRSNDTGRKRKLSNFNWDWESMVAAGQAHLRDPNLLKRQWQLAVMPRKKAHSVLWFASRQWTVDLYFVTHAMISGHFQVLTYCHNSSLPLILFDANDTDTCTCTQTFTQQIHTYILTMHYWLEPHFRDWIGQTEVCCLSWPLA